jgi:hypothetical protein
MAPAPSLTELVATVDDRAPGDDPLVRLGAAAELAEELGGTADALLNHFVEKARAAGASWTQIGSALGVTKQGAQQRFVGRSARAELEVLPYMDRVTARARTTINAALKEARHHGHSYIGTEHLLLGLLHEPKGLAVKALESAGCTVDDVRAAMEQRMPPPSGAGSGVDPMLTPRAKRALDLTLGEAVQLGHNYIGTEHLLLGLVKEGEGLAAQTLADLGVTQGNAQREVIALLTNYRKPADDSAKPAD